MIRHRLSGSKLDLAKQCLFWAQGIVEIPPHESSAAADSGSAGHESLAEDAIVSEALRDATGGLADREAIAEKWELSPSAAHRLELLYAAWSQWWSEFSRGYTWRTEVPYAFDTATGASRELRKSRHRDYSDLRATEIPATIDAEHVGGGRAIVVDFKTGRSAPTAEESMQLAHGAACIAGVHGVSSVRVVMARMHESGVYVTEAELDTLALDSHAASVRGMIRRLPMATPSPGSHCEDLWCPALAVCKGPKQLAVMAPELAKTLNVHVSSNDSAAAALGAAGAIEAFAKELKRKAAEWADANGGAVTMPDGKVRTREKVTVRRIDSNNDRVHEFAKRRFGENGYERIVKREVTLTLGAMEKEAARLAPNGQKKTAVEEFSRELETTGAIKPSSYMTWSR